MFKSALRTRALPVLPDLTIAALVVLLACLMVAGLTACSGPSDVEVTAAAEREAHDKKITFTLPVEYTATVSMCNRDGCKTRYYYPRQK